MARAKICVCVCEWDPTTERVSKSKTTTTAVHIRANIIILRAEWMPWTCLIGPPVLDSYVWGLLPGRLRRMPGFVHTQTALLFCACFICSFFLFCFGSSSLWQWLVFAFFLFQLNICYIFKRHICIESCLGNVLPLNFANPYRQRVLIDSHVKTDSKKTHVKEFVTESASETVELVSDVQPDMSETTFFFFLKSCNFVAIEATDN